MAKSLKHEYKIGDQNVWSIIKKKQNLMKFIGASNSAKGMCNRELMKISI